MSGATNRLIEHVDKINYNDDSEYDVVVSSGEQVTAGLMSLALKKLVYHLDLGLVGKSQ